LAGNVDAVEVRGLHKAYGQNVVLTEHWDHYKRPNGEEWLTITQQIEDPQNLRNVKLIAPVFKKEANGAKWDPTPCSSRW